MNAIKNHVQLIGNLGKDVDLISSDNGKKFARFTMATNSYYKNKEGVKVNDVQWHNIKAFGNQAETMEQILKKGSEVIINGKLAYFNYVDKDGVKRYISEVVVKDFMAISKKEETPF